MTYKVLITCGVFEPGFRGGGPVRSVTRILETLPADMETLLITSDRDVGVSEPYPGLSGQWIQRDSARVFYLDQSSVRAWFRLWRELRHHRFDLLYVNSLWSPLDTILPVIAARIGLLSVAVVLVAPRGELSPGALELKARKKKLFLRWWGPFLRRMGVRWHATAQLEASDIRAVCPWAIVEVSTDLSTEPIEAALASDKEPKFIFVSRICLKKNLDLVLRAMAGLQGRATLDIYGPIEDRKYWAECQRLIGLLPSGLTVTYRGVLAPAEVKETFAQYDAFVFPTRGENFGHVIAESLAAHCPVICSDQTPWTPVFAAGAGVVLPELTERAVAEALEGFLAMSQSQRQAAKEAAGRAYTKWWSETPWTPNILQQMRSTLESDRV